MIISFTITSEVRKFEVSTLYEDFAISELKQENLEVWPFFSYPLFQYLKNYQKSLQRDLQYTSL
jgi:hypothetical protein